MSKFKDSLNDWLPVPCRPDDKGKLCGYKVNNRPITKRDLMRALKEMVKEALERKPK